MTSRSMYRRDISSVCLLMLLFTYVISVFVVHGIEKESDVIGALYALGVKRRDLMMHYLTLPVIVTTVAGIIGFLIGISNVGIPVQMADAYAYYSIPDMDVKIPPILVVYGIVMPPLAAIVVNYFVIRKKLSQTALSLIKNEVKRPKGQQCRSRRHGICRKIQSQADAQRDENRIDRCDRNVHSPHMPDVKS